MRRRLFCIIILLALLGTFPGLAQGTQIVLSFTGDCTIGSEDYLRHRPTSFDSHVLRHGYGYPFAKVQWILGRDDVTCINFEGVLYDGERPKVEKTYNFRGPSDFVEVLRRGSVELSFLGNNHIEDYGRPGYENTIRVIEEGGLNWFAASPFGLKTWIFEKNGVKVGFAGCYASYWVQEPQAVKACFDELKEAGCDFIVGVMHGGGEYSGRQGRTMERLARFMIDNGAGLVAGHHPHVLHGIEVIDHATVVYSLGNFAFGGNKALRSFDSLIAQFRLDFSEDKRYLGHQLTLYPALPSGTLEYNNFQPVLAIGEQADRIMRTLQRISPMPLQPFRLGFGAVQDYVAARPPARLQRNADISN